MARPGNRLAAEPSPYLRQHAANPVDWWPWGQAALEEARRRDVPVFLSVGYATCHWCHVMAHESFEDPEVARRMNASFVCVKVDREERPDLDDLYMAACQLMTGSGGWPLTAILTPEGKPFFAGTYFPRESRYGRIGMLDLVPRVAEAWRNQRAELEAQAGHVLQHLRGEEHGHEPEKAPPPGGQDGGGLGLRTLEAGADALAERFDGRHGGFGGKPKFPSPHLLLFLLRQWHRTRDGAVLDQVVRTLGGMARGGIHDHLGGGFHRYSTDAAWHLPHFEKMLYDQAMLALAYTEAHEATGDSRWAAVARDTLDYVLGDLADPAGGLRCAEDADSEGVEGRFYLWTRDEVVGAISAAGADAEGFCRAYGIEAGGNVHDEATGQPTGANVLHLAAGADPGAWQAARDALAAVRARRPRPLLDDKVLVDWNGLAIAALASAGRALGEPRYVAAAERCARFVEGRMRRGDGRLRHRWRDGAADDLCLLDDHAFMLWGLLELYAATFEPRWLAWATELAEVLQATFADPAGGLLATPAGHELLGVRRKGGYDGAIPSGDSVAAFALHRLGLLTGDARWTRLADAAIQAHAAALAESPAALAMMLCALDLGVGPTQELVVAGSGPAAQALLAEAAGYHPRRVVLAVRPGLAQAAPWTGGHEVQGGRPTAYLCEGNVCRQPVTDPAALRAVLAPS